MPGTSWKNSNHMDWIQQLGIMQGAMAEERFPPSGILPRSMLQSCRSYVIAPHEIMKIMPLSTFHLSTLHPTSVVP